MAVRTPIRPVSDAPAPPRELRLRIDPLLFLAAIGLIVCSVVTLKGATVRDVAGSPNFYVYRQLAFGVVGVVVMYALSRTDYSRLRELRYPVYTLLCLSILVVAVIGTSVNGATMSIDTPLFNIQPSELGKVLLVVAVSGFIVDNLRRPGHRTTARIVLIALLPTALVIAQDFGTALAYLAALAGMLFVAGVPVRHFVALGALGALAVALTLVVLPAAGVQVLKPYQTDRLTSFLHPDDVLGNEGYQQAQSKIAIGSGEKTGRGVENATQTGLDFLPEHHTDFVFAVVGETYGFAGAAIVLSLYALLIWRGLHILTMAKNLYGALLAGGITLMLLFEVFINVGMTVGVMPITGIPSPLLSYGGSSVLSTFLALGLLQSIHAQARETNAAKSRAPAL